MMNSFVGIDIAAKSFDLAIRKNARSEKAKRYLQNSQEYEQVITLLVALKPSIIVMEATGVYYLDLAVRLSAANLPVAVINPASYKKFAELKLKQSKTDAIDASLLAEYAECIRPQLWSAPSRGSLELKDIGRQLNRLTRARVKAKNRLHALHSKSMSSPLVIQDELEGIDAYSRRINLLTTAAKEIIENDDTLRLHFSHMKEAKGIADTSAISILSEFVAIPKHLKAKQVSKYAGLDIKLCQSGTSVNKPGRISKAGNAYLRSALFMPAMSAATHDENARAFKEALVGRGKKKIQANVAIMRKYLTGLWSCYVNNQAFDSSKLFSDIHKKALT